MIPPKFEYQSPTTVPEALRALQTNKGAKVLAGGQSLIPLLKLRLASPTELVDLRRVEGLSYIREAGDALTIGAMTTHDEVARSPLVNARCDVLAQAARHIGDQQIRNRGTIGGVMCHADPSADFPTVAIALDAKLKCVSAASERAVGASDFFKDVFTTDLHEDELVTEVAFPMMGPRTRGAYLKFERVAGDFAVVAVCAVLSFGEGGGVCERARLGLGGVGPTPMRAARSERILSGKPLTDELLAEAANAAAEDSKPWSDLRGSERYKREMVAVFVKRAVKQASAPSSEKS